MSRAALILALPVVFGCSKASDAPAVDTSAPVADAPAAPVSPAGKWSVNNMPQDKDTVVASYVLDITSDQAGWKLTFPGRDPLDVRVISMDNDSIVTEVGPFPSVIQNGVKVNLVRSSLHLDGNKLTGTAIVHYDKKTADSVVTLRQDGTRQ